MARAIHHTSEAVSGSEFWKTAAIAGLIGGLVFMMAEMLLVMLLGQSLWAPPRMIAAVVLGAGVLPPPADFDTGVLAAAMAVHLPLSVLYGFVIGALVRHMGMNGALVAGVLIGLVIYFVNFYLVASVVFEWFAMARNWVSLVTHALFGAMTAWAFVALAQRRTAARAAPGR